MLNAPTMAASTVRSAGNLDCRTVRTATITCSVDFADAGDTDFLVSLYFSPDGVHYDTISYAPFELAVDAGETVQRTMLINMPEHGYMEVKVTNQDDANAVSNVMVWPTIVKWRDR